MKFMWIPQNSLVFHRKPWVFLGNWWDFHNNSWMLHRNSWGFHRNSWRFDRNWWEIHINLCWISFFFSGSFCGKDIKTRAWVGETCIPKMEQNQKLICSRSKFSRPTANIFNSRYSPRNQQIYSSQLYICTAKRFVGNTGSRWLCLRRTICWGP